MSVKQATAIENAEKVDVSIESNQPSSVKRSEKIAYGAGGLAENMMHNAVNNMANPVFNVGLGVSPVFLGLASSVFRLWDAVTDPVMGWVSDRFESRFGRRKPFIVLGAILSGLFFSLIWWAPFGMSETQYFWWFLLCGIVFYSAFTVFGVPYLALGYEMSSDYHERTKVMAFRTGFASIGGVAIQWLFWMTQRDVFSDTVEGMRYIGLGVGVILIFCGMAPGLFVKEKARPLNPQRKKATNIPFKSLFSIFKVKPFLWILATLVATVLGMFMVAILGFYVNVYYVFGGDLKVASTVIGFGGTAYHLCCIASVGFITWVSTRVGKQRALMLFLLLAISGSLLKWVCFTPAYPYLQLVVPILMAPGLSAVWTLLPSMVADVTDYDELHNGIRREGSFGAIYSWTMKLGFAFCFFVAGLILKVSGFDESLGGEQSEETLTIMRIFFTVVPALGLGVSILLISRFPISEQKSREIREQLSH